MKKFDESFRILVFFIICTYQANSTTITSKVVTGSWTTGTNWVGNVAPGNGDDVVIASGANITMVDATTCASLTITGTLTTVVGSLTVNGNVTGGGTITSAANTHIISLTGNWSFSGTSSTASGGPRVNFTGTANQSLTGKINTNASGGYLYVNKTAGTVTLGVAMNAATFNLNAGTFDASTFLLTSSTRTFTAGRISVGASNWTSNFSGTLTQPSGSVIEYYYAGGAITPMNAVHGGDVEFTGNSITFSSTALVNGTLSHLSSSGGAFTYNGKTIGSVYINRTNTGYSTFADLDTVYGTFIVARNSNGSNVNAHIDIISDPTAPSKTVFVGSTSFKGEVFVGVGTAVTALSSNNVVDTGGIFRLETAPSVTHSINNLIVNWGATLRLADNGNSSIMPYTGALTVYGTVIDGVTAVFSSDVTIKRRGLYDKQGGGTATYSDTLTVDGAFNVAASPLLLNSALIIQDSGRMIMNTNGQGATFNGPVIVGGTFIEPNGNGSYVFNGPVTVVAPTDTFSFNTAGSAITFSNKITTNGVFMVKSTAAINFDTVEVNNGGQFITGDYALQNGLGNTRTFNKPVTINNGGELTIAGSASPPTFLNDVTINNGGEFTETGSEVVTFSGDLTNNGTFTASTSSHVFTGTNTISGDSAIEIPNVTITGTITNSGTLEVTTALSGGGSLIQDFDATLIIGGTFTTTNFDATRNGNTVEYNGTSSQTVRDGVYQNLNLSNTSSTGATLGSSTTVLGELTFINGILTLGNNNLFMDEDIVGAGPTKYVATTGTGRLIRTVGSTPVVFAVGTATTYNPITVTNTGTQDNFGVSVSTSSPSGPNDANVMVTRYWNVNEAVSGGSNLTIKLGWLDAHEGGNFDAGTTVKLGYYNGAAWTPVASTETNAANANLSTLSEASGDFNLTAKNMTSGVTFAVGKDAGITQTTTATIVRDATSLAFGTTCVNTSTDLAYSVSGYNLSAVIAVACSTGYQISLTPNTGFTTSFNLTPTNGYVPVTPIYVRFTPTSATSFGLDINHTSTGASSVTNDLSGTGATTIPSVANTPTAAIQSETSLLITNNMTSLGCTNATVTERGFYYSTTSGFTPPGTGTKISETAGAPFATGSYDLSVDLSTLTLNTTYYFKSFATNAYGSAYSATQGSFATPAGALYAIANNGVWTTNGTWSTTRGGSSSGTTPGATTAVYIPSGINVIANTGTVNAKIIIIEAGGTLTIQGSQAFTAGIPVQLAGTIQRDIANFPTGTFKVLSGGRYIHNVNGQAIPTATWAATSICDIRGVVGTALTGLNQTFGNITYNCTGQTATNMDFPNTGTMAIQGDLTFTSMNGRIIELNQASLSVNDFSLANGTFGFNVASATLNVLDDVSLTGGTLNLGYSGAFIGTLNVAGDFSYTAGSAITETSTQYGKVVFNGTGVQAVTSGGTISNDIRFTVNDNAKVDFGTYSITGSTGTFAINPSSTLYTKNAGGFSTTTAGAIQVTSSKYFSPTATYVYNGNSAQVTGDAFRNNGAKKVVINNASGVTASSGFSVTDSLIIGDEVSNAVFSDGGNQITSTGVLKVSAGGKLKIGGSTATTIPAFNTVSLASGTTVEFAADVAQSVAALSVPYQNLAFSGTGQKNGSGTITVSGNLQTDGGLASMGSSVINLTGNLTGAGNLAFTSGTLNIAGNWTNSGTLTPGTSTVNYTQTVGGQTISGKTYNNLSVQNTSSTNSLGGDASVAGALAFAASGSGKINIGAHTLGLNGTLANHTASKCFVSDGAASNISIAGSGALGSSLYLDQTTPGTTNRLNNLTYNRTSQTVTLGDSVEVIGTITPTAGTLATGNKLKLVSNASGTARVAAGPSNNYVSGNVIAERYVPPFARRWRFFSPSTSGSTLQDLKNETYITGTGGTSNGFDETISNQAGVYTYNEALTTGNLNTGWTAATNIANTLPAGAGIRLFIRGDRSDPGRLDGTVSGQNAVTLNLMGPLNMGDITLPVTYNSSGIDANDGWNFVGNPYASQYDWNAFFDAECPGPNCTNIGPTIYIYNPNGDGYISYNALGDVDAGLTGGIIPTVAGFWVKATGASPTLILKEQYKVGATPAQVFKTNQNEGFKIRLEKDSISYDDVIIKYKNGSTVNSDPYDIVKLNGTWTNISAYGTDNVQLTASVRPLTVVNDTIKLNINASANGNYIMRFYNSSNIPIGENVYLIDNYLNTVTDLKTTNEYPVTIDYSPSGNGTYGLNRFYIVAGVTSPVPVKWLLFTAKQAGKNSVGLNWSTAQETNNQGYEVERSTEGKNFSKIGEVEGNGSTQKISNYKFTDNAPHAVNYYRLKQVDIDGKASYSEVRKVELNKNSQLSNLKMYPVPAKDILTVSHNQPIKEIRIYNISGKLEYVQNAASIEVIMNIEKLAAGVYIIEIQTENGEIVKDKLVKN